jgi:ABC-type multidrug transport system fused ATPase/permease subunit
LVEVDSEKIGYLFFVGPKIVSMPVRVLISVILLFNIFGPKFTYALLVLFCLIGLILLLQVAYLRNLKILLEKKDDRMSIVTYIFQIIKNIKINGWEDTFAKKIKERRNEELDYLRRNFNIEVTRTLINSNMPLVILIVSLGIYVFSNKALEISDLFTFPQLITLMTNPLMAIPVMISEFFSNLISITRLQKFLFTPEHDYTKFEDRNLYLNENLLVKFDKATFGVINTTDLPEHHQIDPNSSLNTTLGENTKLITDISFSIKKGE